MYDIYDNNYNTVSMALLLLFHVFNNKNNTHSNDS